MGTSTSSSGPGPGVSLDPPWLDAIGGGDAGGESNDVPGDSGPGGQEGAPGEGERPQDASPPPHLAPARRFASAKRDLSKFASNGDTRSLGRGIGHYSRSGMGGSRQAANRMRASTRAGAGLVSFLEQVRDGATAEARRWVDELVAGAPSADAVVDAIVEAVMPAGGSADEESIRDSMAVALSELMVISPECDVLLMSVEDTWTLMQLYLSREVCNRLRFDMGQLLESAKLNPAVSVQRELEMRQFVRNEISVQLAELRGGTPNPTQGQLDGLMQEALRLTFAVYEGVI